MNWNIGKKVFRNSLYVNRKIFIENANKDLSFKIPAEEKNSPHSIIPRSLYNDFDRENFRLHKLTFPIKVPLRVRRIDTAKDVQRYKPEPSRYLNYNMNSGNEILLSLREYVKYDLNELAALFTALSNKEEAPGLALETHPLVQPALRHLVVRMEALTVKEVVGFALALERLGFEDAQAWQKFRVILYDKFYALEKLSAAFFAETFRLFFARFPELLESEQELLLDQLPRYLRKMKARHIATTFEMLVERRLITSPKDYLFAKHFFIVFWKTPRMFTLPHFTLILRGMKKINFVEGEGAFLAQTFLPAITHHLHECESPEEISQLITEIEELESFGVAMEPLKPLLSALGQRLVFSEQVLGRIKRSEFIEIVKSDLAQYREKRRRFVELMNRRKEESPPLVNPFKSASA